MPQARCSHPFFTSRGGPPWRGQRRMAHMKSAIECFGEAKRLKELARTSTDELGRTLLLEIAQHWRLLGEMAKAEGTAEADLTRQCVRLH
jgi:hypothetical protein